ncbi:enoyl-CoA hydratase/isomerase family protein [Oricola sp.]|uniref:enoyl-CoA hydratase/isomerase family protein n=1 Tax=Oricola sp. TaxID=1979950 RepID=UPI0025DEB1F9|nr:enoyl-CoA hydratase/isomerase family protein [Oricola sp.]MCI5076136.1 enoyl-CoA hydratase/isomerase family protein [Oricola sp.]
MGTDEDIDIRETGRCGRITLTRPKALNALSYDMAMAIEAALDRWQADEAVDMILVDAEGDRAFCAGGDIAAMHSTGTAGDFSYGRTFWSDEYRMNAKIAHSTIPYVAIMDGIVMGGGAGISVHGSHRVVTERSMVAMPECGIGLIPDVGCSLYLARAPEHLGEFLAMTGWRMDAGDAIHAGFADVAVRSDDLPALKARLEETADPRAIDAFADAPGGAGLAPWLETIDRHFGRATALDCLRSLEADPSEFAQKAAGMIRRSCPISLACAFELIRDVRNADTVEEALRREYRFTYRSMSQGEFLEGVRAQIIEKDRDPKWRIARLDDVTPAQVDAMLAPLGDDELTL